MATPKKSTPKVKITGKVTTTPGTRLGVKPSTTPSITRGTAMYASPKVGDRQGTISNALALKVQKARDEAKNARTALAQAKMKSAANPESKMPKGTTRQKLEDTSYKIYSEKKAKANRRSLDAGRTAARGENTLNNALRPKKK
jgi:hypothetical protein